jgi:excisionase family DNA binding protein
MHIQLISPSHHSGITKAALTVNEFLFTTGIGRTKFYSEVKSGRIKVVKVGTKTLVLASELAAWLARLAAEAP